MAKNMALLEDGTVINIEWVSDETVETAVLVNLGDVPVITGDTYADGVFYRDGERVMTAAEAMAQKLQDAEKALSILLGGEAV